MTILWISSPSRWCKMASACSNVMVEKSSSVTQKLQNMLQWGWRRMTATEIFSCCIMSPLFPPGEKIFFFWGFFFFFFFFFFVRFVSFFFFLFAVWFSFAFLCFGVCRGFVFFFSWFCLFGFWFGFF